MTLVEEERQHGEGGLGGEVIQGVNNAIVCFETALTQPE